MMNYGKQLYSEEITIGNVTYLVGSYCTEYSLYIEIMPLFNGTNFFDQAITRDIADGIVDWHKTDNDACLIKIKPIAENIAKKTDELLKRVYKMKAFL